MLCNIPATCRSNQLLETNQGNNPTDRQLVSDVLNGDTKAFGIIIKNTERLVAQIVFKMINDAEDRRDVVQDIYLKAFNKLSTFRFQSKLSTWIGRITYNTCLHYLERKKSAVLFVSYDRDDSDHESMIGVSHFGGPVKNEIEASLFNRELSAILNEEIEALPVVYKTLITLYHNEELSYAEISEITAMPEGTVKNYLFRARKTLRKNLLEKYKKENL